MLLKRVEPYQQCVRCIQDTTVPGIRFDAKGECNFCALHDRMVQMFPNDARGEAILQRRADRIRRDGKGRKWDCVVGISGGRDSTYLLWFTVNVLKLRPLAVHFNDGFDNPVAGENMVNACQKLGVELRTVTSDWREAKDLKIMMLKASTPDLNLGTDVGIGSSLYGVAAKEGIRHILIGQSFRTEGIKPLKWAYFDGTYLKEVHKQLGTFPLRPWRAEDPGFHLEPKHLLYYTVVKRISVFTPLYYHNYIRKNVSELITRELGWVDPGAHYFDDLYHALIAHVLRVKFNADMRLNSYSALVRSGQMTREEALERVQSVYAIEDPDVIRLCIKRLGMTREEFDRYMDLPHKTFLDYPTSYNTLKRFRWVIWLLCRLRLLPEVAYDKYFKTL